MKRRGFIGLLAGVGTLGAFVPGNGAKSDGGAKEELSKEGSHGDITLRAGENGRIILRAANGTPALVISPDGRILT